MVCWDNGVREVAFCLGCLALFSLHTVRSLRSARKIGAPSCCENILGFSHVHGVFAKALSLLSALWRRAILVLMFSMWKA